MREPSFCCGFGGSFSLEHGDVAERIVGRKLRDIEGTGAAVVVADNPGCLLQIAQHCRAQGVDVEVAHPVSLLARALDESRAQP